MLDLPTNTFDAYKLREPLLVIMDLEKCYMNNNHIYRNEKQEVKTFKKTEILSM